MVSTKDEANAPLDRMDYEVESPDKFDQPKLLTLKLKSSPGSGVVSIS